MSRSSLSPVISPPPLKRRRISPLLPETSVAPPASSQKAAQDIHVISIYSWNVNGINAFLSPDTPSITKYFHGSTKPLSRSYSESSTASLRICLYRWSWPSIVVLQETKVALKDTKAQAAVRRSVNAPLEHESDDGNSRPAYDTHFCLPKDKHNATGFGGKVYGVCTLVKRDMPEVNIKAVEWDLEGRILLCEVSELKLVVINVYAVNGTDYDYRDSETGKVVGTRHYRKREFHTLLANEIKLFEDTGWHVVVAGDINVSRTRNDSFPQLRMGEEHVRNRADFEKKFIEQLGMLDTFRLLKGDKQKYTYRPPNKPWGAGGDRVDLILATKGLEGKISDADILDNEAERGPSDHVPHFIELTLGGDRDA